MSVPFTVIALYPYPLADQEPAEDDLYFNAKQLITVTTVPDDDWYGGSYTDSNGQYRSGYFPQRFVKIHTAPTHLGHQHSIEGDTELQRLPTEPSQLETMPEPVYEEDEDEEAEEHEGEFMKHLREDINKLKEGQEELMKHVRECFAKLRKDTGMAGSVGFELPGNMPKAIPILPFANPQTSLAPPIPGSVPPIPSSAPPIPAPVPRTPRAPKRSEHTSHHGPGSASPPPYTEAATPVPRAATVHSESRRRSTNSSLKRTSSSLYSVHYLPLPILSSQAPPIPFQEPLHHHTAHPPPPPPSAPFPLAPPPAVPLTGDNLIDSNALHKSIHSSDLVISQASGHTNPLSEDSRLHRGSMEASRASSSVNPESFSQEQRLSEYVHGNYGDWWVARKLPGDSKFKHVLYETFSVNMEKRCSRSVLFLDYYILNEDYSQIIWELSCDANHPENILSYSETLLPTPSASQEYLKKASSTYGPKIIELAKLALRTSLKQEFISWIVDQLPPTVLRNVGKSYGIVIHRNIDNKDFRNYDKIRPGDIFSAIHAKFESLSALHKKSFELGSSRQPHMAVISEFDKVKNKFRVLEQDSRGVVQESSYKFSDMKSGCIEVFRVVGKNYVGW
ncbi:hypothetical protein B5S33_g4260 [[Candida] boidinii]|nr:hypothetical protein B5S33_g4260 [[Candida] boidinii]